MTRNLRDAILSMLLGIVVGMWPLWCYMHATAGRVR